MILSDKWKEFELFDAGDGEKIEKWGKIILKRPDPQAIWPSFDNINVDARYIRSSSGGGSWRYFSRIPRKWDISYDCVCGKLSFIVEPTNFKHTGIFPEQAANWDFMSEKIMEAKASGESVRVLNLFGYTGAATVACSMAGADEVVHVDASKGMNLRAKENLEKSGIKDNFVRYMTEDVNKFVEREIRRGRKYDGIIMDPPSYGRGPSGELWKLEDLIFTLVEKCAGLLSDKPLFFIINSYTTGLAPSVISNIIELTVNSKVKGEILSDELGLPATKRSIVLPCGCTSRWERK